MQREKKCQKVPIVASAQTVVDPWAVVIAFRYAISTKTAVLRSSRLNELASSAPDVRTEKNMVERVIFKSGIEVCRSDIMACMCDRQVGEHVR